MRHATKRRAVHKVARRAKPKSRMGTLAKVGAYLASPIPDVELLIGSMANPDSGIRFVLGITRRAGKRVSEAQSVIFDKLKWTADAAKEWLRDHGFAAPKVDEGATFWRFRQQDPKRYKEFRTVVPGTHANPVDTYRGDAYRAGRAALRYASAKHGTVNLTPSITDKVEWGHAWHDFMQGWRDEQRAKENPTPGQAIHSYDEHLATTLDPAFQEATPDEQAAAMTVQDAMENPSPVVVEIQRQLLAQGFSRTFLQYVAMDQSTLKVSLGTNGAIIRYDPASDLYDVTEYHGFDKLPMITGIGVGQLHDVVTPMLKPRRFSDVQQNPGYAWAVQEQSAVSGWHTVSTWITHEAADKQAKELSEETGKTHRVMHKESGRVYQTFKGSRAENPSIPTPIEIQAPFSPARVRDFGLTLVHQLGGEPRNYLHEIGVHGQDPDAVKYLQDAGYRKSHGWLDRSRHQWWVYRKEYPLSVAKWAEQNPATYNQITAMDEQGTADALSYTGKQAPSSTYLDKAFKSALSLMHRRLVDGRGKISRKDRASYRGVYFRAFRSAVKIPRAESYGNPESSAADLYEEFHGRPPGETLEIVTEQHEHEWLTGLGTLVELKVATVTQLDATISFARDKQAPELCSSEDGRQLYIEGGDQTLNLKALRMAGDKWLKDSMVVGVLYELTYQTEKKFHKFALTDYFHRLGEETGVQPTLLYDPTNKLLSVSGGQYQVKPEGIIN